MEDHTPHDNHRGHAPVSEAAHGQAMPAGPAHPALDDDQAVHQHDQHAGHSAAMFRDKFWCSLLLAVPVVDFSEMFGDLLGYQLPFPGAALDRAGARDRSSSSTAAGRSCSGAVGRAPRRASPG